MVTQINLFRLALVVFLGLFLSQTQAAIFISADIDLRYKSIDFKKDEFELQTTSLSLRKVFADKMGDRIILFLLGEANHNFKETMVDQGYIQYKGPLGKWNVTLGRYRLPYGLLPNYSTDRLPIKTIEYETIGFPADNGIQLSGTLKDFDYALSFSQGVGQVIEQVDIKNQGLVSFRLGYQGADFEDFRIGLSGLSGRIAQETHNRKGVLNKKFLGIDLIKYTGQSIFRGEFSYGKENDKILLGIFSGVDYTILPKIDLTTGYALVKIAEDKKQHSLSFGLTFNIFSGFQVRTTQKFALKGGENEFSIQVYYIFSRAY